MNTIDIDTSKTFVLLIGASKFIEDSSINDIPNVEYNIEQLQNALLDTEILGIPETNMMVSLNESKISIERKLITAARETKNSQYTLVVYYSGHGILSGDDFKLYLTTPSTTRAYLESDGISIDVFQKFLSKSRAGRKIVILDACHSGQIHNSMGDTPSQLVVELSRFEGTYVITSASEHDPALYPEENPNTPTYFTGKFIDLLKEGIDNDKPFLTISDIFDEIESDFRIRGNLPIPQQSCLKNADEIIFAKNKKFDETLRVDFDWDKTVKINNSQTFSEFLKKYPNSTYTSEAKAKIAILNESEEWSKVNEENTILAYYNFIQANQGSKHVQEALAKIDELEELEKWNEAKEKDTINTYFVYKKSYPEGKYLAEANERIPLLVKKERERRLWEQAIISRTIEDYQKYLTKCPDGIYVNDAKNEIDRIINSQQINLEDKDNESEPVLSKANAQQNQSAEKSFLQSKNRVAFLIIIIIILTLIGFNIWLISINQTKQMMYEAISAEQNISEKIKIKEQNKLAAIAEVFDAYVKNGDNLEKKGEEFFYEASKYYEKALALNYNKSFVEQKLIKLNEKINVAFEQYKQKGDILYSAAGEGKKKAKDYYLKAKKLKPYDEYINRVLETLK